MIRHPPKHHPDDLNFKIYTMVVSDSRIYLGSSMRVLEEDLAALIVSAVGETMLCLVFVFL